MQYNDIKTLWCTVQMGRDVLCLLWLSREGKAIQYWWGGIRQWRKFPFSEANCYKLIHRASSSLTSPFNVAFTDTESDRLKSCVSALSLLMSSWATLAEEKINKTETLTEGGRCYLNIQLKQLHLQCSTHTVVFLNNYYLFSEAEGESIMKKMGPD